MRCTLAAIGLVALSMPLAITAAPIPEYRAVYRTTSDEAGGGTANVSLSYDSVAERYMLTVAEVDAESHEHVRTLQFQLVEDSVRPVAFREERRKCVSCARNLRFSWENRVYEFRARGSREVQPITRDLERYLAWLVAQLPGRRALEGADDALGLQSMGTVELTTALGTVRTERLALRSTTQSEPTGTYGSHPSSKTCPFG